MDFEQILQNAKGTSEVNDNDINQNDDNYKEEDDIIENEDINEYNEQDNELDLNQEGQDNEDEQEQQDTDEVSNKLQITINGQDIEVGEAEVSALINRITTLESEFQRTSKYKDVFNIIDNSNVTIEPDLIKALIDAKSGNKGALDYLTNKLSNENEDGYSPFDSSYNQNSQFPLEFEQFWNNNLPFDFKAELETNPQGKALMYQEYISGRLQKIAPIVSTVASIKGITPVQAYIELTKQQNSNRQPKQKRVKTKRVVQKSNREKKREAKLEEFWNKIENDDDFFEKITNSL